MPAKLTCTRCGNTIAADVFDGLCPACMGRAALGSAPVVLDAPRNSTEPREPTLTPEMEAELARLKPEEAGEWIGSYKLMEQLGQGGFGTVWVADQEKPVRRRVALKIIKLGMDTKEVIARFEQERQALAMMDHPNIAKVFDAGATRWGRPYFVMELVRGIKITEYCDQANFPTAERLALFIQVCNAVQHAHQKGIIHRDLKPSNILVTLHDGVPVPKVIDFGVAKATQQQRLSDLTIYTQFEQMIGTPLYMSPEQAEMSGLDIDTRSDIYALGVLLYELLTGRTPIDAETMAQAGMDEIRRLIREVDPPRPSQRLKTLEGNELTTVAKRRHTGPAKLAGSLRGDLDWIVLKCLEKDRKRRYDTANGLALDLQRHLNNEIISARPPTTRYLISKIIKRNRLAFFMGTAIAVSLVVGMAVSTWLAIRASRAEVAANDARLQAEAVILFLTRDLLYKADPEENARGDKKVTMEEVLASAANQLDEDPEIARHPEIEATLRLAVGNTYYRLGAIGEAERYLRRAVELRASRFGPANLETLAAQEDLARFLVLGAQKFEEAEGMAAQTLKSRELLLTANHPDTIESARTYGYVMANVRKLPEAEQLAERVLKANERYYGSNNERTISALGDLAMVRLQRGDIEGYADASWKEFAAFQRIGKLSSKDSLYSANNAAMSHTFLGEPKLAEAILKAALDRAIQKFGEDGQITSHLQNNLGRTLADLGQFPAAAGYVEKALKTRMSMEAGQESAARSSMLLGRIKLQCHDLVGAEKLLVDAREFFRKRSTAKKELEYQASCWLGMLNWERNNGEEANGLLAFNAEELFAGRNMMTRGEQRVIGECALQFYRANDPQKAEAWQASLKKYLSKQ